MNAEELISIEDALDRLDDNYDLAEYARGRMPQLVGEVYRLLEQVDSMTVLLEKLVPYVDVVNNMTASADMVPQQIYKSQIMAAIKGKKVKYE